jgi:AcrR family transcriptional regulator
MSRPEAILEAALALFAEQRTLESMTIRAICARAEASTGSVYHHFGDRGAILLALYRRIFENGIFPAILEGLRSSDNAEQGIRQCVRAYLEWVETHAVEARFIYAASGSPDLAAGTGEIFAMKTTFLQAVAAWLEPHVQAGSVRRLPPWALDPLLFGAVHEVCRRWLAGAPIPMSEAKELLESVVWRAIAPESKTLHRPKRS